MNELTPQQKALYKKAIGAEGMPDDDLFIFLKKAHAADLDPLRGHCLAQKRNVRAGGSDQNPQYKTVYAFQTTQEGAIWRASTWPGFKMPASGYVMPGDVFETDQETYLKHVIGPDHFKTGATPLCGWAKCIMPDGHLKIKVVSFREFLPSNASLWGKMPGNQVEKTAVLNILKQCYPRMYVPERDAARGLTPPAPTPSLPAPNYHLIEKTGEVIEDEAKEERLAIAEESRYEN